MSIRNIMYCTTNSSGDVRYGVQVFMHTSRTQCSDILIRRFGAFHPVHGAFSTVLDNILARLRDISSRAIIQFDVLIYPLTNLAWFFRNNDSMVFVSFTYDQNRSEKSCAYVYAEMKTTLFTAKFKSARATVFLR